MKNLIRNLSGVFNKKNAGESKSEVNILNEIYGHDISKKIKQSVDKYESAIPWFTYPAIEYLEQFDLRDKTIFEWGSGNSSLFFARRSKRIISIEHDLDWYNQMSKRKEANQEIRYVPINDYPFIIKDYNTKFDIIIIDGQRRFDCVEQCVPFLKEGGMIILDNSDWFYISAAFLREKMNLLQLDFHGFGPVNDYTWTTSFLLNRNFDFSLAQTRQPSTPKGGLLHDENEIIVKEDDLFKTSNSLWINRKV